MSKKKLACDTETIFRLFFAEEKCKSCNSIDKSEKCNEFDECSSFEREYFMAGIRSAKEIQSNEQLISRLTK